jgi:hypothetical protein
MKKDVTPERLAHRALDLLATGDHSPAEGFARKLIELQPDNASGWAALRGALAAQDQPADEAALRAVAAKAAPGVSSLIECIAARRLSKRGLIFDQSEQFRVRAMADVLEEVSTAERLRSGQNVVWFQDLGGEPVERWPVLELGGAGEPAFPVRYQTAPKFVASIRNAAVVGDGLVLTEDGEFVREVLSPSNPRKYKARSVGDRLSFDAPFIADGGQLLVRVFSTPAFLMAGTTDTSFGDFLVNFATRLALYEAAGLDCPILLREEPLPQVLPILEALGVGPERLIFHAKHEISLFPKLFAPCWPSRDKLAPVSGVFDIFQRAVLPADGERPLLYLHRRNVRKRPLANEEQVCELFAARGFRIVDPGALTFEEVRRLFAAPACVAGPYGSAFHNLVFSGGHPMSLVMMPPHRAIYLNEFAQWQVDCGNRFAYVRGDPFTEPHDISTPWTVSLDKVERALDRFMDLQASRPAAQA